MGQPVKEAGFLSQKTPICSSGQVNSNFVWTWRYWMPEVP